MSWRIICADVMDGLAQLEDESVQCVVGSPPYWGLRDYGAPGQIGLESTPEEYVAKMVEVFCEVRRVLRKDGTVWLNLGDSYASQPPGNTVPRDERPRSEKFHAMRAAASADRMTRKASTVVPSLKPKDLVGIPWRVAFALQADGWYLRSDIIWGKPNPMPESVTDRPTKSHEYLFLLTKSARYYWDADAVREPHAWPDKRPRMAYNGKGNPNGRLLSGDAARLGNDPAGRNIRSVWNIATEPYPEAHFATFPKALVVPCVKAGSQPGDMVLDPFCGSGTAGVVALRCGRSFIGIELNPEYAEMAKRRVENDAPLFNMQEELA